MASRKIEILDGEERTVRFTFGGGSVQGRVTTLSGKPLAGVVVAVRVDSMLINPELRRLGNLEIRVEDVHGVPLAASFVGVTDQESGRSVSEWISRGFVQTSDPYLTTDESGKLTLRNLPAGKFTLEVPGTVRVVNVPPGPDGVKVVLTRL